MKFRSIMLWLGLVCSVSGETITIQSLALSGGRDGEFLRFFSIVAKPDRGVEVYYVRDNTFGSTILYRKLLSNSLQSSIPSFLVTSKVDIDDVRTGPIATDHFETEGSTPLFRLGSGLLGDTEALLRSSMSEWTLHPYFGWVYTKHYPWVYPMKLGQGWFFVLYHGLINFPPSDENLFLERMEDEHYTRADPATFFHYPGIEIAEPKLFFADTAYFVWNAERGWLWYRDAHLPWAYDYRAERWIEWE